MPKPYKCPLCSGTKVVQTQNFSDSGTHESSCKACKGTGEIPPSAIDYKAALTEAIDRIKSVYRLLELCDKPGSRSGESRLARELRQLLDA